MRLAALGAALLTLAACQQDPPSQGARDSSVPPLTVEGYGPMRIGMTSAEARQVSGQPMNNEALEPDVPAIRISPQQPREKALQPPYHRNIRIEGNTFVLPGAAVLSANRVRGLSIVDNEVRPAQASATATTNRL